MIESAPFGKALISAIMCAAVFWVLFLSACLSRVVHDTHRRPEGFVSLSEVDSTIELDIRYQTSNNFVGRPIRGYREPKCILTREAASALARAQRQARAQEYSIKVYDCYRPQRAVLDFFEWAKDMRATQMQHRYYPRVPKDELFTRGYIAEKSGHSRGSTVDVTLMPLAPRRADATPGGARYHCRLKESGSHLDDSIDMGTGYDCFDELAHTDSPEISEAAKRNRRLLRAILERVGFINFEKEWWHYTLKDEPFPDTYFDFVVQ